MSYVAVEIQESLHRDILAIAPSREAAIGIALASDAVAADAALAVYRASGDLHALIVRGDTPSRCTIVGDAACICREGFTP